MSLFVQNLKNIYIYKSSLSGGLTVRPFLVTCKLVPGDKEGLESSETAPGCCWSQGGFTVVRSEVTVADGAHSSSLSNDELASGSFIRWRLFLRRVFPSERYTINKLQLLVLRSHFRSLLISLPALNLLMASRGDHSSFLCSQYFLTCIQLHPWLKKLAVVGNSDLSLRLSNICGGERPITLTEVFRYSNRAI